MTTREILLRAKAATATLSTLTTDKKNAALLAMADALVADTAAILAANAEDMEAAKATISAVMLDRLALTEARIAAMADGSIQYEGLITHRYPLAQVNEALEMMRDKKEFFTKVMLVND